MSLTPRPLAPFKFPVDTTLIGLIPNGDESTYSPSSDPGAVRPTWSSMLQRQQRWLWIQRGPSLTYPDHPVWLRSGVLMLPGHHNHQRPQKQLASSTTDTFAHNLMNTLHIPAIFVKNLPYCTYINNICLCFLTCSDLIVYLLRLLCTKTLRQIAYMWKPTWQ